jgi:predicted transcriptional regulator of viral defense system
VTNLVTFLHNDNLLSMTPRSLSPLESSLILKLEWDKHFVVTTDDVIRILGISNDHARQVLHRLARDRWLALIAPGKYELIPAERGEFAFADTNPLFIGSALVAPYYFTYATAAFYHGLTTQAASVVYLATMHGRPRQIQVREKGYRLVIQPAHKFFGFVEANAYGTKVNMAEQEKVILDCLDRPGYAGDIPEITGMIQRGKSHLDWQKMIVYAARFKSQALLQRLGYLLDLLNIAVDSKVRNMLLTEAQGNSKCYLGQPRRWHTGGKYNPTWRVVDNIPRQELMAELETHG